MADIAIFLPSLEVGGAEKVMLNLVHGLLARGITTEMILVDKHGAFLPDLPPNVPVVDLHKKRALSAFPELVRHLRSNPPRVLLSNLPHLNLLAIMARRLAGAQTRLVLVEHNDLKHASLHGIRRWERFFPTVIRHLYGHADAVVAVSQGVADGLVEVAGLPRDLIKVIYNPIVTPGMEALMQKPVDNPWFLAGQPPVILAAGRLTRQKDYPTLLRAFAVLRGTRSARLFVLGEGELKEELQALVDSLGVASDVFFAGFDPNPLRYMSRCAVFALSSAWEGFGNVLVEALACGAQVVSTNCPSGPAEILSGGRHGRLVSVGDHDAFASALESALDHPFPVDVLRQRASDFDVVKITAQYLDVLLPVGSGNG